MATYDRGDRRVTTTKDGQIISEREEKNPPKDVSSFVPRGPDGRPTREGEVRIGITEKCTQTPIPYNAIGAEAWIEIPCMADEVVIKRALVYAVKWAREACSAALGEVYDEFFDPSGKPT